MSLFRSVFFLVFSGSVAAQDDFPLPEAAGAGDDADVPRMLVEDVADVLELSLPSGVNITEFRLLGELFKVRIRTPGGESVFTDTDGNGRLDAVSGPAVDGVIKARYEWD